MKAGNFFLRLGGLEGFKILAPETYWNATEDEILAKTGGCGPGKIGDWFVPDTMYGESVFLACQVHDWMYGQGETLEDKKYADLTFLWNMTEIITGNDGALDLLRLRRVMTYFQAVFYGGKDAFEKGETPKVSELELVKEDWER